MIPQALRALITTLVALAAIFLVMGFIVSVMGCSNHTAKETLRVEDNAIYYRSELAQWSLLSFSEAVDVEHVTPLSSTCIGSVVTVVDPNAIDSAGGFLGEIVKVILTK